MHVMSTYAVQATRRVMDLHRGGRFFLVEDALVLFIPCVPYSSHVHEHPAALHHPTWFNVAADRVDVQAQLKLVLSWYCDYSHGVAVQIDSHGLLFTW